VGFDVSSRLLNHNRRIETMNITILTYGTRGDVEPFLPLSIRLMANGHSIKLAAPYRFKELVEGYGISFIPLPGDPEEPIRRIIEANHNFIKILNEEVVYALEVGADVIKQSEEACKGADLIIHSVSHTIDGHTRAHEMNIPDIQVQASPMYTPTGDYPEITLSDLKIPSLNYLTHIAVQRIIWWLSLYGFRRIRRKAGLPRRKLYFPFDENPLHPPMPILCAWSPSLLPPSKDWNSNVHVIGSLRFDRIDSYQPPASLQEFLSAGAPPVCVTFGSMVIRNAEKIDRMVREALMKTGQRGIILSGWGKINGASSAELLYLDAVPHDWLLPRCNMVIHHGGSGTTSAGLRAGIPNIVVPFMIDQPFWARRVHAVGAGPKPIPLKRLSVERLTQAISEADSPGIRERVQVISQQMRNEDGVSRAVELIESHVQIWNEMVTIFDGVQSRN